mmetsp:Transcript_13948/g.45004  ORF Transcript_13948/g.45004 Transcript_13948/m.45004 type:complete len:312 (+) Transcript_13948:715-1650(+)
MDLRKAWAARWSGESPADVAPPTAPGPASRSASSAAHLMSYLPSPVGSLRMGACLWTKWWRGVQPLLFRSSAASGYASTSAPRNAKSWGQSRDRCCAARWRGVASASSTMRAPAFPLAKKGRTKSSSRRRCWPWRLARRWSAPRPPLSSFFVDVFAASSASTSRRQMPAQAANLGSSTGRFSQGRSPRSHGSKSAATASGPRFRAALTRACTSDGAWSAIFFALARHNKLTAVSPFWHDASAFDSGFAAEARTSASKTLRAGAGFCDATNKWRGVSPARFGAPAASPWASRSRPSSSGASLRSPARGWCDT